MNIVTVMYHYVRKIKESKYPRLRALEFEKFKKQLNYLQSKYKIISVKKIIEFLENSQPLPKKACLLTFDDGYKDHLNFVLPELIKRKINGIFFPVGSSTIHRNLLEVNKIQFILEKINNLEDIILYLDKKCLEFGYNSNFLKKKRKEFKRKTRFDNKEINYIKKILQFGILKKHRSIICNDLFNKYVTKDQLSFANDLYMSRQDIKKLKEYDMEIGSHTMNHEWLGKLNYKDQCIEIKKSVTFLKSLGLNTSSWTMCYPFGSYNESTKKILKKENCKLAFTTKVDFTCLHKKKLLELSRFDTNDFFQG